MTSANYADSLRRGLAGDSSSPPGAPAPGALDPDTIARRIAAKAPADRKAYGDRLLQAFVERNERLGNLMEEVKPADWEKGCYHTRNVITVRQLVDLAVFELVVHEWDIRSRLEPGWEVSAHTLPVLVDRLPELVKRSIRPDVPVEVPVRFGFDVTGPVTGSWTVIVDTAGTRMETGSDGAELTISCDTEASVLILIGRLQLRDAIGSGRASVVGQTALIGSFERWMRGI